ncbi:MAG TPA: hypothetical protein VHI52_22210 [Verrucomicrobiae bacterium]|nr:hypothetical protein [Verrucomicrobiae bacterium]
MDWELWQTLGVIHRAWLDAVGDAFEAELSVRSFQVPSAGHVEWMVQFRLVRPASEAQRELRLEQMTTMDLMVAKSADAKAAGIELGCRMKADMDHAVELGHFEQPSV